MKSKHVLLLVALGVLLLLPFSLKAQQRGEAREGRDYKEYYLSKHGIKGDSTDVTAKLQALLAGKTNARIICDTNAVYYLTYANDSLVLPTGTQLIGNGSKFHFEISGQSMAFALGGHDVYVENLTSDCDSSDAGFNSASSGQYGNAFTIGNYGDGTGYYGFHLKNVSFESERVGGNAMTIQGNSYNGILENCRWPEADSTVIYLLMHWGNVLAVDTTTNPLVTTHPHDIDIINPVFGGGNYPADKAMVFSACWGINIIGGTAKDMTISLDWSAGDYGFIYADTSLYHHFDKDLWGYASRITRFQSYQDSIGFLVHGDIPDVKTNAADDSVQIRFPIVFDQCFTQGEVTTPAAGFLVTYNYGVTIQNSVATDHTRGVQISEGAHGTKVLNNDLYGNTQHGIYIDGSSEYPDNSVLSGNRIWGNQSTGIYIDRARRVYVNYNYLGATGEPDQKTGVRVDDRITETEVHLIGNHVVDTEDAAGRSAFQVDDTSNVAVWLNNTTDDALVDTLLLADDGSGFSDFDPTLLKGSVVLQAQIDTMTTGSADSVWDNAYKNTDGVADSAFVTKAYADGLAGTGEVNTLLDTGTFNDTEGFGQAGGKTGTALKIKGLIEGANIVITQSGDSANTIGVPAAMTDVTSITGADGVPLTLTANVSNASLILNGLGIYRNNTSTDSAIQTLRGNKLLVGDSLNGYSLTSAIPAITSDSATLIDTTGQALIDFVENRIDDSLAAYLPLAGSTMTGDIDVDSNTIVQARLIDMTFPSFIEDVEGAAFRTYIEFGADIMYIGATNVSNVRERVWDFGLAEMTALTPATIGQVKINGDVNWEGNAIADAYVANDITIDNATMADSAQAMLDGGIDENDYADQSIKGDHIDSTAEDFVFSQAFKATSAVSDSQFVTKNYADGLSGSGEVNTLGDTGTFNDTEGFGLAGGKTGTALKVKGLIEGINITITASGDSAYTIAGPAASATVDSAQNVDTTTATAVALQEKIADVAGGAFTGNTETRVTVTYQDADNTVDVVVDDMNPTDSGDVATGALSYSDDIRAHTSEEMATKLSDETGSGLAVFGTSPTFLTGITVPNDAISPAELDEGGAFVWTSTHDFGGAASVEIPNSDNPTTDANGEIAADNNSNALEVYIPSESESGLISFYYYMSIPIVLPDSIQTYVPDLKVWQCKYPFGIEIDSIWIQLDADAAYSMVIEEWSGADPPVYQNAISTVTTGAADTYAIEIPDTDGNLDFNDWLVLDIATTDVPVVTVGIMYHISEGN